MQKYRRVTLQDRINIQSYLAQGLTPTDIAKHLGFHKSSVSREIQRNKGSSFYQAAMAEERAEREFQRCRKRFKIQGISQVYIHKRLSQGWSPELISQRQRQEKKLYQVSAASIYRWVRKNPEHRILLRFGYKRRGFGRRMRRAHCRQSAWKQSIRDRPAEVEKRQQLGHWERDTFFGAGRTQNVLVLCERKSRFVLLRKGVTLKASKIAEMTKQMLKTSKTTVSSITNDNGSEFFDVSSFKVPIYFCDVLKPQQRGTIENTIGHIRRFIKRGDPLEAVSAQKISALQRQLNLRPRRVLDYQTPYEVLYNKTVALAL